MITTTNHLSITVKDLDKVIAFFRDVMEVDNIWPEYSYQGPMIDKLIGFSGTHIRVAKVETPNLIIEFIQYLSPAGRELNGETNDVGCPHIGFEIEDIDYAYEKLSKNGVRFKSPPVLITSESSPMKGWKAAYCVGPENINLELMQRPKPAKA